MNGSEIISSIEKLFSIIFSLPVVALAIFVIFRKPILKFVRLIANKLEKLEFSELAIGKDGVSAKFLKAETTIGETNISVAKTEYDSARDNLVTYTCGAYKFRISWDDKTYAAQTDNLGAEQFLHDNFEKLALAALPVIINRKQPLAGFVPNVNVLVQPIEAGTSILKCFHFNLQDLKSSGFEILSTNLDAASQSGIIEYTLGGSVQFAKVVVHHDMSYTITATANIFGSASAEVKGIPAELLLKNSEIRAEVRTILNSFELLTTAK